MTETLASTSAVILAAGSGSRMGKPVNKIFLDLGGVTILEHTLSLFATLTFIEEIVLVVSTADRPMLDERYGERLEELGVSRLATGGKQRIDSSRAGIEACCATTEMILIHDAARPFPPASAVETAARAAMEIGAAILAVPVQDTLKRSTGGRQIDETLPRADLFRAQTPQVFRRAVLLDALRQAGEAQFTDDASLVEATGNPVALVPGHEHNIKITTPDQLELARVIFQIERNEHHESTTPSRAAHRDRL